MLDKQTYSEGMYNLLPKMYRTADLSQNDTLQKFLKVLFEDGSGIVLDDINITPQLIDPLVCPTKFLPQFCESMGYFYTQEIAEKYQRKFMQNVGQLHRRKGTKSAVKYLVRSITGLDCELIYTVQDPVTGGRTLKVILLIPNLEYASKVEVDIEAVSFYIASQIPFYLNSDISYSLERRKLNHLQHTGVRVSQYSRAHLVPKQFIEQGGL